MSGSHFDKLLTLLDRQSDDKLNPNMLIGYLGMVNLMSIMSVVHSSLEAEAQNFPVSSGIELPKKVNDEMNLNSALTSLMGKADTGSGPDLSGLLNMVGSNKKPNPQLLLTLMNLLNSMKGKEGSGEESPPVNIQQTKDTNTKEKPEPKPEKKRIL